MQKCRSALRSLRGKKGGGLQDDSDPATAKIEELQSKSELKSELKSESELQKRVKRWLSESSPPKEPTRRNSYQNQDMPFEASQQMDGTMAEVVRVRYSEIYHPDFADWAAVYPTHTFTPEKSKPDEILQAIDAATESLSKVIGVPFCTFR
jgi:hypothetical protein